MVENYKKKPWTKIHDDNYRRLYDIVKQKHKTANTDTYIDDYKVSIGEFIEKNKSWSIGTKEIYYFMLSRYFYNHYGPENHYYTYYANLGYEKYCEVEDREALNILDEKEEINFRSYEYTGEILKDLYNNRLEHIDINYQYLLISLLYYQPPVRTSFYTTAKFITRETENDENNNFVKIDRRGGNLRMLYILNRDKVSDTYFYKKHTEYRQFELPRVLCEIIDESLKTYPRAYLFENPKTNKPYTSNKILSVLRNAMKTEQITIDMMRSSYITYIYKQNPNYKAKEILSYKMRHSVVSASKKYNKITEPKENLTLVEENEKLKKEIEELKAKIAILESKNEEDEPDDKTYNKNRKNLLYNLNVRGNVPKIASLEKYNIKFNEENNIYE